MVNKFFWFNDTGTWLTEAQTESHANGYENKFGRDFNNDGLISEICLSIIWQRIHTLQQVALLFLTLVLLMGYYAAKHSSGFDVLFEGRTLKRLQPNMVNKFFWFKTASWLTDAQTKVRL